MIYRAMLSSARDSLVWGTIPSLMGSVEVGPMVLAPGVEAGPGAWVYVQQVEESAEYLVLARIPDVLLA